MKQKKNGLETNLKEMAATFVAFSTYCDTTFWNEVNRRKLNEWMLDESPRRVICHPSIHDTVGSSCRLSLSHESFIEKNSGYHGEIILYNTLEAFKASNKAQLLKDYSRRIWDIIRSGEWIKRPEYLDLFFIIAFADLKKFKYAYWTCVPALCYPNNIGQKIVAFDGVSQLLKSHFIATGETIFIFENGKIENISKLLEIEKSENVYIVLADPSPVPNAAGWPARNLLAAIAVSRPTWTGVQVVALRGGTNCQVFQYTWESSETPTECPKSVGWERDAQGKLSPYQVDLSTQFDPKKLMAQSVDLNLSLIKWRLVPDIQLDRYVQLKVLIFGAGTLGCNLARGLIGWGVRNISFVDNSTVSYSNPVRQSLSEFADARDGRGKAETAAAALRRIFPQIEAEAHRITVPMPGHTIDASQEQKLAEDVEFLDKLVERHDVVFLALDSREARWLPTILANKHRKIAISVALGFDTYVIIRHGIGFSANSVASISLNEKVPYDQLSCYFCSDVTAPGNSTSDRTLDQQCTVSRPGLSMVASGVAVELLSSILQFANPLEAPANLGEADDSTSLLGAVPHQIRGFISKFQQMTPCVKRFDKCVACGAAVAQQFEQNGWKFVRNVMNSPSHLETVTGLDQLQYSVNDVEIDFDDSDSAASL
ncbi:unnamed protein product [Caenorhabditis bovis]|uniref:Ubiquitin-like modifier-activating enzyme ATG7 n=1 Tax=Caenorhabditis bovis TaxID=2654633 RepID=A0A8S1F313_9PELO|nr:unnamed protein product [Caenorhabditis bovis]